MIYLCSYRPIIHNKQGRLAVEKLICPLLLTIPSDGNQILKIHFHQFLRYVGSKYLLLAFMKAIPLFTSRVRESICERKKNIGG